MKYIDIHPRYAMFRDIVFSLTSTSALFFFLFFMTDKQIIVWFDSKPFLLKIVWALSPLLFIYLVQVYWKKHFNGEWEKSQLVIFLIALITVFGTLFITGGSMLLWYASFDAFKQKNMMPLLNCKMAAVLIVSLLMFAAIKRIKSWPIEEETPKSE